MHMLGRWVAQIYSHTSWVVGHIINGIYPSYCVECKVLVEADHVICVLCKKMIQPIATRTLVEGTHKISVYAASLYDGPLQKLVRQKNHGGMYSSMQLGRLVVELVDCERIAPDLLVPIPLHWRKKAKRGFNQAEIIGKAVAKKLSIPLVECIIRIKDTKPQHELTRLERIANLEGAFAINPKYQNTMSDLIKDKHITIIDDQVTSGATINAMARHFFKYKPARISVISACRK